MADEVVLTTCPRDCYDGCGVAVVKRDGAIRHVRGDLRRYPATVPGSRLAKQPPTHPAHLERTWIRALASRP
jgi:Molybdopterin oxidoreductase Fe4S4 domain